MEVHMNRKGFMMAEVVVVSAIVMVTIIGLYQSYNKLYSTYATRLKYHDAETLYRLGYYRDILIENGSLNTILSDMKKNGTKTKSIYKDGSKDNPIVLEDEKDKYKGDTVFLISTTKDSNKAKGHILENTTINGIHSTYQDYLSYLTKSTSYGSNYIMVIESCKDDLNDCYYAYLEIYDGKEENS